MQGDPFTRVLVLKAMPGVGVLQVRNRDQYGRGVASCSLPGAGGDLGAWLVNNGLAVAYRCSTTRGACVLMIILIQGTLMCFGLCFCVCFKDHVRELCTYES